MNKIIISIVILSIVSLFLVGCAKTIEEKPIGKDPLLGSSCGTASPDSRDECCQRKDEGNKYDLESGKCITVTEEKTEETQVVSDGLEEIDEIDKDLGTEDLEEIESVFTELDW